MTGPDDGAELSGFAAALEGAWVAIRERHPDTPEAVVVVGTARGRAVGHFATCRWEVGQRLGVAEVKVCVAALHFLPEEVFQILLHEAVHGVCATRGLRDTSRGGRYHNNVFATVASELGLRWWREDPHGVRTGLAPRTVGLFASEIAGIAALQRLRPSTGRFTFYTVGYGSRTPSGLVEALRQKGVRTVADIRHQPSSARLASFARAKDPDKGISGLLGRAQIAYTWLPALGNPWLEVPAPAWVAPYRRLLARASDLLTEGLDDLDPPWALLCAEANVHACHRALVAEHLVAVRGWRAVHL